MTSDFRFALRSLLKTPAFSLVVVLTLGLCIGANSAIFSVVRGVLLKPYPWPESERLVYCYNTYPLMGLANAGVSIPDYLDRREGVHGFADAAMYTGLNLNVASSGAPERVAGTRATPSLFSTLRTGASLGRVFTDADAQPGAAKVAVLSDGFWRTHCGADPAILGTTIRLNDEPYTVVGVMPPTFYFPSPRTQVWVPFAFTPEQRSDAQRGTEYSTMIARLNPGASLESVQRELESIQRQLAERLPRLAEFWKTSGFGGRVVGFHAQNTGDVRKMLWLIQAGVAAALLVGCANVASLLIARALARERELSIRSALGATRAALVRLLLVESVLLFVAGGGLGIAVGYGGLALLRRVGFVNLPRGFAVELDPAVLGFTLLSALLTGLIFGAFPGWVAARADAAHSLKDAGTRTTSGRQTQRLRGGLIIAEIALAVALVSTASLLVKSFARLHGEKPGFVAGHVLTAQFELPDATYRSPETKAAFLAALEQRLGALPGVTHAALASSVPFSGSLSQSSYSIEGYNLPPGQPKPHGIRRSVTPGYFQALGIPLLRGREFTRQDDGSAPGVVIIDRVLADRYWPGADPIGRRIRGGDGPGDKVWEIVGVVPAVKSTGLEDPVSKETLYFPIAQSPVGRATLVLKTALPPETLVAAMREAVRGLDPALPLFDVKTMTARVEDSLVTRRAPMVLLSVFSAMALLLAALGVYGVLTYAVTQRRAEFGIRLALGATRGDIAGLVFGQAGRLLVAGLALGLVGYIAFARLLSQLVFAVAPTDPEILAAAPLVLAGAALLACWIPARRATRVDPLEALRTT